MIIDWSNVNTWLYGMVMTLIGGIVYLVRRVFTNQAEINLIKEKMALHEQYRAERDKEIKEQLVEIRSDLKSWIRGNNQ